MSTYIRTRARDYARQWALGRNPHYADYSTQRGGGLGGYCPNVVSQWLYAGGGPMGDGWCGSKQHSTRGWVDAQHVRRYIQFCAWATRCDRNELGWGDLVFGIIAGQAIHAMIVT